MKRKEGSSASCGLRRGQERLLKMSNLFLHRVRGLHMLLELGERVELHATGLAIEVLVLPLLLRLRRTMGNFVVLHQLLLARKGSPAGLTLELRDHVNQIRKSIKGYYCTGFEGEKLRLSPVLFKR